MYNQIYNENQYSGHLREGLSFVDTQGKTKTLVYMCQVQYAGGLRLVVRLYTSVITTKTTT